MNEPANAIPMAMARAKRQFPGHDVEAVYPIGWPVYSVRLTLTVLAEHTIATAARFILRLVGREPAEISALSRLLGISDKFVAVAAAELVDKELAVQRPDLHLEITEHGRQAIANGGRSWSPQREHTEVPFCPLTRRVLGTYDLDSNDLMYPDMVGKNGLFVLHAGDKPRLSELRIEAIRDYAREDKGIKPGEITEVAEVHNRNARLRYRNDITIVKLVAPSNNHSAFAAFRGREYLAEETIALQRLADSGANLVPEEYEQSSYTQWSLSSPTTSSEEILRSTIRDDYRAVLEVEQSITEAMVSQQDTQDAREREELASRLAKLEAEKDDLSNRLAESERQLKAHTSGTVRIIKTEEHRPLLLRAIDTAAREIILVSAFVNSAAFNSEVCRKLHRAMERGVRVRIAWGLGTAGRGSEADRKRIMGNNALDPLRRKVSNTSLEQLLTIKQMEIHQKFIICDDRFVAQGSFNWLSFNPEVHLDYISDQETSDYSEQPDDIARWKSNADELFR